MSVSPEPVRLTLLAAAPMYYQAPLYRLLAADSRLDFTVIFASDGGVCPREAGYGEPISWDVDMLEGYRSVFLHRASTNPIQGSFLSLCDPDVVPAILRLRPEVLWLHGYNFLTHLLAATTQRLRGGAILFREEQTLLHRRAPWKAFVKQVSLRLLFSGARGLYIGSLNREWFRHYGMPPERLFCVPYAAENEELRAFARQLTPRRAELRADLGIPADSGPVILSVGRLISKKQPLVVLDAFERVRSSRRCTLLFVGSGELEDTIRAEVERRSIPDVVLAGFRNRSQIADAYACADVFVLASRLHETWGMVVNEALNFALPVVVSDKVGSAPDLVRDGENGFVVPADDVAELARRLATLVDEPELRAAFGARSLSIVEGRTHQRSAESLVEAVAAAVGPARWRRAEDA